MQKRTGGNGGNREFSGAGGRPRPLPPAHLLVSLPGRAKVRLVSISMPLFSLLSPVQLNGSGLAVTMQKRTGGNEGNREFSGVGGRPRPLPPAHLLVSLPGRAKVRLVSISMPLFSLLSPVQLNGSGLAVTMQKRTGGNEGNREFSGVGGRPRPLPPAHLLMSLPGRAKVRLVSISMPLFSLLSPVQLNGSGLVEAPFFLAFQPSPPIRYQEQGGKPF